MKPVTKPVLLVICLNIGMQLSKNVLHALKIPTLMIALIPANAALQHLLSTKIHLNAIVLILPLI
jgi:hypothetical protein